MAEKYPVLPDRKQEVLSIELARWALHDDRERAVAVTAERRHLSVFVDRDDGRWASYQRPHHALDRAPTSPAGTTSLRWSGQIAVATDEKTLVVAYKRRLPDGTALWLERLQLDPDDGGRLVPVDDEPVRVPLGGLDRTGFWLRGASVEGRLFLVTQGVRSDGTTALVLLTADEPELASIQSSSTWRTVELDAGGYDLDALQVGRRLEVVHRRRPGYVTIPRLKMPTPDAALLVDDPIVQIPQLSGMLTPLVRVSVDLTAPDDPTIDDTLPPVEHPQILRADPFLVTGDRLLIGTLDSSDHEDGDLVYRFRSLQSDKVVIRRHQNAWLLDDLYPISPDLAPRHLSPLRGAQKLLGRTDETFELGTLLPQQPVALLHDERNEKRDVVVLAHEQRQHGTLVATTFHLQVHDDPLRLLATSQGFAVLDIGHEQLGGIIGMPYREENGQFEPLHSSGPHAHVDGFHIRGPELYKNTMGGAAVAPISGEASAELYAYVDMGDAGLRVFFESNVEAPAPAAPPSVKVLEPGMVPGPGGEAHAWIDLVAPLPISAGVPPYRAPYADLVRGLQDEEGAVGPWLTIGLLIIGAGRLITDYLEPPSLLGYLQPSLDILPLAVALSGGGDSQSDVLPLAAQELDLDEGDTLGVETFLSSMSGAIDVESPDDAPFLLELEQRPSVLFPGTEVTLKAETNADDAVLVWTIATAPEEEDVETETETVTGPSVTRTFDEPGVYPVTLVASNNDDETVTLERRVVVGEPLWETLWTTFDTVNDSETFGVSALTLTLLQYRLDFSLDDGGARDRVRISWRSEVPSTMRFLGGGTTQGRVEYSLAIAFAASSIELEGPLAAAVDVRSVRGTYEYGRQYTPSVLTSDRRRRDPVQERRFPTAVETVQSSVTEDGNRRPAPEAAGLSMKPASPTSIRLADVEVRTQLAAPARAVGWLIGVLGALGLAAAAAAGVVAALIAAAGIIVAVGIALGALVGILITLGLTWLLVEVIAPPLLQWAANGVVRSNLEEGAAGIREALDAQRFLTYAGEGLAEGIAGQVIAGAQAQGFELDDPGRLGRDRHRHAFFETIFVSDGLCRVRVRVPPP